MPVLDEVAVRKKEVEVCQDKDTKEREKNESVECLNVRDGGEGARSLIWADLT